MSRLLIVAMVACLNLTPLWAAMNEEVSLPDYIDWNVIEKQIDSSVPWVSRWYARAMAYTCPLDWELNFSIVTPLQQRDYIPKYVKSVEAAGLDASITIEITYRAMQGPRQEMLFAGGRQSLDNESLIVSFDPWFAVKSSMALLVRNVSADARVSTASLTVRRLVKNTETGKKCELAIAEQYEFDAATPGHPHAWRLVRKGFALLEVGERPR